MTNKPRLLDRIRNQLRLANRSPRTAEAYCGWVERFVRFHGMRHPSEMGAEEVRAFLSHLAVEQNVAAATQNQALSALVYLYRQVLEIDLPWVGEIVRARRPRRLPTVLSRTEVRAVLAKVPEPSQLVASLLYGSGLRLLECLQLRIKDLDFERATLAVREARATETARPCCRARCTTGFGSNFSSSKRSTLATSLRAEAL